MLETILYSARASTYKVPTTKWECFCPRQWFRTVLLTGSCNSTRPSRSHTILYKCAEYRDMTCHFGGVLRWFHWMMSLDNLQCVRWRESHRDDIFVSVNNHWGVFLWNRIYTDTLSSTPFYDRTAIKLYSLTLCVLYPKHYSYQHPSYLGVLDMCLILSLYLHVLSLSLGFRYHYLWYCLYVYLLIVCMYYFICRFYVSLSFDIVYMYIYLCIYLLKVGD